jgi:hypothetical protein
MGRGYNDVHPRAATPFHYYWDTWKRILKTKGISEEELATPAPLDLDSGNRVQFYAPMPLGLIMSGASALLMRCSTVGRRLIQSYRV